MRKLAVGMLLLAPLAAAAQTTVPDALDAAVAHRIAARWQVPVDALVLEWSRVPDDPLPAEAAFRLTGRGREGWFVVLVERPDATPYAARVRAGHRVRVAVAARDLPVGRHLTEEDIDVVEQTVWGAPTSAPVPSPVGWMVRRRLAAGERLRSPAVTAPVLVRSGDAVHVTFHRGRVTVTATGTAVGRGTLGDVVAVRLDSGRRRVQAVVTGARTVQVTQ